MTEYSEVQIREILEGATPRCCMAFALACATRVRLWWECPPAGMIPPAVPERVALLRPLCDTLWTHVLSEGWAGSVWLPPAIQVSLSPDDEYLGCLAWPLHPDAQGLKNDGHFELAVESLWCAWNALRGDHATYASIAAIRAEHAVMEMVEEWMTFPTPFRSDADPVFYTEVLRQARDLNRIAAVREGEAAAVCQELYELSHRELAGEDRVAELL